MQLPITRDACATARKLIADGLDGDELLEFVRGDVVCLRGKASAFASRMVKEGSSGRPRHVRYVPFNRDAVRVLARRKRRPARLIVLD